MSSETGTRMNDASDWYSAIEMDQLLRKVKQGDAIEFYRGNHWGIFVGNIEIRVEGVEGNKAKMYAKQLQSNLELKWEIDFIKKTNEVKFVEIKNGVVHIKSNAYVDCTELQDVLAKSQVRINNEMSEESSVADPQEIISTAIKSMGSLYHIFNNCEHSFVIECRCAKQSSKQADTVMTVGSSAGMATGAVDETVKTRSLASLGNVCCQTYDAKPYVTLLELAH